MNISVYKENASTAKDNIVTPDVVQNRFGIVYGKYTMLLLERDNKEKIYIPLHLDGKIAAIGICLTQVSQSELSEISKFIFIANKLQLQSEQLYYYSKPNNPQIKHCNTDFDW